MKAVWFERQGPAMDVLIVDDMDDPDLCYPSRRQQPSELKALVEYTLARSGRR